MCGGGYLYYTSTQAKIEALTQANAVLESNFKTAQEANEQNLKVLKQMEMDIQRVQRDFQEVQENLNKAKQNANALKERLGEHDIGALAEARPASISRVITNASTKAFRCLELLSGSALTQSEKEAKDGKAFNSECPWLFDDLVAR
jgi:chromosome segregation ATPase